MTGEQITLKLTMPEALQIKSLLVHKKHEGTYCAPAKQYWKRHDRIDKKLEDELNRVRYYDD